MTKQKTPHTTVPEDEDEDLVDPWDKEGFGEEPEPEVIVLKSTPVKDEGAQLNASEEDEDEWAVQYDDDGSRALSQPELRARKKREKFLRILSSIGSVAKAAAQVKLTPRALMKARDKYPDFAKNWEIAMDVYKVFVAEDKLHHRAIEGTLEPITFQGRVMGYKRVYDSGLAQFWYKHNMRDKYGDKTDININANVNHGVILLPARGGDVASWEKQALDYHENSKKNVIDLPHEVVEVAPVKKVSR